MAEKIKWDDKDPNEIDDRTLDWSKRLPSTDTITDSDWTSEPSGLTITPQSTVGFVTRALIEGGSEGIVYAILNRITTSEGRTLDQTVYLKIVTR